MAYWNRQTQTFWALEQQKRRRERKAANEPTPDLRAQVIAALFGGGEQGVLSDPSDGSTCFQDLSMTTPAGADDPVRVMLDLSGNDSHFTAPNDAARPIRKTDGTYWWLEFDGTEDQMDTPTVDASGFTDMFVCAAIRAEEQSVRGQFISHVQNPSTLMQFEAPGVNSGRYDFWARAGQNASSARHGFTAPELSILTGQGAGASIVLWQNGVEVDSVAGDRGSAAPVAEITLGARSEDNDRFFKGRIYGAVYAFSNVSAQDRSITESFMASKSGVTL